jgi:hypothetical protein
MSRRSTIVNTGIDADALAFLQAAAITDLTITNAINRLVLELKYYGLWTKMKAIYPFVGGTASTHKWNLKDPQDTNGAFRLVFFGGITHDGTGITGNTVNGFCDTFLSPSAVLTANNTSVGVYVGVENASNTTEIGCSGASFLPIIGLSTRGLNDETQFDSYDFTQHRILVSNTLALGLTHGSVITSTDQRVYKNGVQIGSTITIAQTQGLPTPSIYILSRNDNGTSTNRSPKNLRFAFISDGLNVSDSLNIYNTIQAFQTTLNRNV